jgi:hypothetical protein
VRAGIWLLAFLALGCSGEPASDGGCPSGQACGFVDHKYFSTFRCQFGGAMGYSWRDLDHCGQECNAAASFGCDASACASGCVADHGTGDWLACTPVNGAIEQAGGQCFLSGSGVRGETIPCVCR